MLLLLINEKSQAKIRLRKLIGNRERSSKTVYKVFEQLLAGLKQVPLLFHRKKVRPKVITLQCIVKLEAPCMLSSYVSLDPNSYNIIHNIQRRRCNFNENFIYIYIKIICFPVNILDHMNNPIFWSKLCY